MPRKTLTLMTAVAALLTAIWRIALLPYAATANVGLNTSGWVLFLLMAGTTAVLLYAGRVNTPSELPIAVPGLAFGGVLFGGLLTLTSLWDLIRWLAKGVTPAPGQVISNNVDRTALTLSLLSGIAGGVFLLMWSLSRLSKVSFAKEGSLVVGFTGALTGLTGSVLSYVFWRQDVANAFHPTPSAKRLMTLGMMVGAVLGLIVAAAFLRWAVKATLHTGWLWLLPTLWMFTRMVRYDVCYALSVNIAPAVYEFLMCGVGLLFLLALAKQMSGAMPPSRWLKGLAAAGAALSLSAPLSRLILLAASPAAAAYCPIPGVIDVAFGLFALTVVLIPDKAGHTEPAASAEE